MSLYLNRNYFLLTPYIYLHHNRALAHDCHLDCVVAFFREAIGPAFGDEGTAVGARVSVIPAARLQRDFFVSGGTNLGSAPVIQLGGLQLVPSAFRDERIAFA